MFFERLRGFLRVFTVKMTNTSHIRLVPDCVRGMKKLEKDKFLHNVAVPLIKVSAKKVSDVQRICSSYVLKLEKFKPVQKLDVEDKSYELCIYLNPEKISCWEDIPEECRQSLGQHDVSDANFGSKEIQLSYDNFKYSDIFNAVLPEGKETVSGFTHIGHIIHLNLRFHLLEYKSLIGQVLLDKNNYCRTVVNKTNVIDNTFRNFQMEIIAGDEDLIVTTKENNCTFQFDFSKVYWNSRLAREHERVVHYLESGDILFDVFCGVGPFAVPIARKKCRVYANDLNPESFKWLNHNAELNKIKKQFFKSYNMDGKDFICSIFKEFLTDCCSGKEKLDKYAKIYVTMNLPAIAVEFLKYFNGLMDDQSLYEKFDFEVIVYCYCFAIGDKPTETAKALVIENIGLDISPLIMDIFDVRNVAPSKQMMKVTIKLMKELLFGVFKEQDCEPPLKRPCLESVDKT